MKKNTTKTPATTATVDPALKLKAQHELARQAASDASREYYKEARKLEKAGETRLAQAMQRRASFEYARALRRECEALGIEVPARG